MKLKDLPSDQLANTFIKLMRDGKLDQHLGDIVDTSIQRKRYVNDLRGRQLAASIKRGDQVKVMANIKPKYMANRVGTVVERMAGNKVEIDFGAPVGRFGRRIIVPLASLDLLRAAPNLDDIEV